MKEKKKVANSIVLERSTSISSSN
uniref:Uncharacterized protein n=1 Tax=Rhizophora mucronata TaxID=61149 RepID=A0A2P2NDK5_RHIMU